jgi:hypothetical protein
MKSTHPKPLLDRITQYGAAALVTVMLLTVPLQLLLAFLIRPPLVFVITAFFTLLLAPFVLLLTASTPRVQVSTEGITIEPVIWNSRFVPWGSVTAVKPYPLLPQAQAELTRKTLTGRNQYRAAEGIMLVIPELPPQYRIVGVLAGEGFTPVIALTNRTHTDYDRLVQHIRKHTS